MTKKHILISGTGRSGTTALVKIMTVSGFDTGFAMEHFETNVDTRSGGGLEHRLFEKGLPEVVKSPDLVYDLTTENLDGKHIDALIVPVRSMSDVLFSRNAISALAWISGERQINVPGGLVATADFKSHKSLLLGKFHELLRRSIEFDLPIIFLDFQRMMSDGDYLYQCIRHLAEPRGIGRDEVLSAHGRIVNLQKIGFSERRFEEAFLEKLLGGLCVPRKDDTIARVHLYISLDLDLSMRPALLLWAQMMTRDGVLIVPSLRYKPFGGDLPEVIISLGGSAADFDYLMDAPLSARRRWMHFSNPSEINMNKILYCWLASKNKEFNNKDALLREKSPASCRNLKGISIFTPAYRDPDGLRRAYKSLLRQNHKSWEWVIFDDSNNQGASVSWLRAQNDDRIRIIDPGEHIGIIGTVKARAVANCTHDILLELDHDDVLLPRALETLHSAFLERPDLGFAFGDAAEIYDKDGSSHIYGDGAAFGFRFYYYQATGLESWPIACSLRTPPVIESNFRHLVGLPNHPRAWARWAYDEAGGHRPGLLVADDFDLLHRSISISEFIRVPNLLYLQFRKVGAANTTFARNKQIQNLVSGLQFFFRDKTATAFSDCQEELFETYPDIIQNRPASCKSRQREFTSTTPRQREVVILSVARHVAITRLISAIQKLLLEGRELVVVSQENIPELESLALAEAPGRLRWWFDDRLLSHQQRERYGRVIASGRVCDFQTLE